MATLALTSLLESTLHFVHSSYPIDPTPPGIERQVNLLEDRVKLTLQILKYLPKRFNADQRLKLLEEKLIVAASEAECSLEKCKQEENILMKVQLSNSDDIDLLNTDLLKTLMPEFFNQEDQLPYVVCLTDFDEHGVRQKICFCYIRSKNSKVEDDEIVDFIIAKSELSYDSGSVVESKSVILRSRKSSMANWFQIRDWVSDPMNMEDNVDNRLDSGVYELKFNGLSSEEVCRCLCQHLEEQAYFIVIHNDSMITNRIAYTCVEETFHHLVFGERSCPQELETMVKDICTSCRDSSFAFFVVAKYLSNISPTTHNWGIVQESILKNADVFHDKNYGIISALIEASETIIEHLEASSDFAEANGNEKVEIDECSDQLIPELLQSSRQLQKVAIVGMGGIGKTTIAKHIFDHHSVSSHFHIRAWIVISQYYQKRNLLIQLLQGITHLTDDEILNRTDVQLQEKVYKCLKGQRYFIIMDDMWSVKAWNELQRTFPDDNLGSRILLTSRESNLIENLNCKIVHRMSLLSDNKSWELLQKKVFGHEICPQGLAVIGKKIAARCGGLPLAIVVIAGVLSKITKTAPSWEVVAESVSSHVMCSESATRAIFALSYEHMPDYLKSCFLYIGAFPGGYEIKVQTLIRLWIAEGFIDNDPQKCLEAVAEKCLHDLIDRSLLLSGRTRSNGKLQTCHIHDLVLEFCLQEAQERKFLDVIKDFRQLDSKTMSDGHYRFSFHCHTFDDVHLTTSKSLAGSALFFGISSDQILQEQCNDYGQDIKIQIRSQKTFSNASLEEMDG